MKTGWLWDRKITERQAKSILNSPENKYFIPLASILLARNNSPKEVLGKYLSPENFCRYWTRIKKGMRTDSWNNPRIEFWQAIYESVRDKLKRNGIVLKSPAVKQKACECFLGVGSQIRALRKEKGVTQEELARKMGISQQIISRIESGRHNVSLGILKKIVEKLDGQIKLEITFDIKETK